MSESYIRGARNQRFNFVSAKKRNSIFEYYLTPHSKEGCFIKSITLERWTRQEGRGGYKEERLIDRGRVKRERGRDRERQRETERDRERQRDKKRDTQRERDRDSEKKTRDV